MDASELMRNERREDSVGVIAKLSKLSGKITLSEKITAIPRVCCGWIGEYDYRTNRVAFYERRCFLKRLDVTALT